MVIKGSEKENIEKVFNRFRTKFINVPNLLNHINT